jgi:hypothetical protein
VTNSPTAGRADVADNVICITITPEEAIPLIGHYLRMTANPIVNIERSSSVYGTMEMTESTPTMVNFYDWGTVSGMPYFDGTSQLVMVSGDIETAEALRSVRMRLARAARALDHLLAALSNPIDGPSGDDVAESAAEAFDRELLYTAAIFDIYMDACTRR